jgi:hypothetical protein
MSNVTIPISHYDALQAKIAELEKELSSIVAGLFSENELAILKLEQQAIGAYESVWFCKFEGVRTDEQPNRHISHLLNARVKELRNQAKALKSEPKVSSEGEFWVGLEESLNQEEAPKEQGND